MSDVEAQRAVALASPPPAPRKSFAARLVASPSGLAGGAIVLCLLTVALSAEHLAPYPVAKMGVGRRLMGPSFAHLLGTDEFGRDMFSRLVLGSRLTLEIGLIAVGISLTVGMSLGIVAAYARGWVETVLMRSADILFSFTETLIALACVAVLGPSLQNAMIAVGIAGIPYYARTCFATALVERSKPYFEGAVTAGCGHTRLILRHLLPNVMPTMMVVATLTFFACSAPLSLVQCAAGRGGPQLFGAWRPAPHARMGRDALGRPRFLPSCAMADDLSRACHFDHCARLQPPG